MDLGAAGSSMILLFGLAGATVAAIYTIAYGSHCFLTIVEQTSNGADDIKWPDEPMLDWLWKGAYLFWLCLVWLGPVIVLGRRLVGDSPGLAGSVRLTAVVVLLFWMWMPVTLLSAQLGPSRWVIFWPPAVSVMFRCFGSVTAFYMVTGPLMLAAGAAVWGSFIGRPYWAILGIPGLAGLWLIYARMFGRLAQIITEEKRRMAPDEVDDTPKHRNYAKRARQPRHQPRNLPQVNTRNEEARVGYDVSYSDETPAEPVVEYKRPFDYDPEGYAMTEETVAERRTPVTFEPSEREMAYATSNRRPKVPDMPWFNGTFTVVLQEALFGAWAWLSSSLVLLVVMVRICRGG